MISIPPSLDARSSARDHVLYRARASTADGGTIAVTLVDISAGGFMARSDAAVVEGDRLSLDLPILGRVAAEVRWALGGRIGCRLEIEVPAATYPTLVAALRRN